MIIRFEDAEQRPEHFLLAEPRIGAHARHDRRLAEEPVRVRTFRQPVAAVHQLRAVVLSHLQIVQRRIELLAVDRGPDVGRRIARIADLQLLRPRAQAIEEGLDDRLFDDRAAGGGAALSRRVERRVQHAVDRHVEIRVRQHDRRILAAHFELHASEALRADLRDAAADGVGSGERDGAHLRIRHERIAHVAAAAGDEIEHAFRNAGFVQDFDEFHAGERRLRRGLDHDGVAGHQRRRELPRRDRDGEVPRRDQRDDAERLTDGVHEDARPLGRNRVAREARAFAREIFEQADGARRLAFRFRDRLAFLAAEQIGHVVEARFEYLRGLQQDASAHRRRRVRPRGEGAFGGVHRLLHVFRTRRLQQRDQVARVGRIAVLEGLTALRGAPFAVDQVERGLRGRNYVRHVDDSTGWLLHERDWVDQLAQLGA
jgi:hypothetical protein